MDFESISYSDHCAVCGSGPQVFNREMRAIRETFHCSECKASLREREQARTVARYFSRGRIENLSDLVCLNSFKELSVYEPGTTGSFRKWFRTLPRYTTSIYEPGNPDHQDLHALTFADETFDLVVSSDIFEHVRNPSLALLEIFRVLKVGGCHIFSVPMQEPIAKTTVRRVRSQNGEDVFLLPPHYHGDGRGGKSLVYFDYGADILELLSAAGFAAQMSLSHHPTGGPNAIATLVSVKVAAYPYPSDRPEVFAS